VILKQKGLRIKTLALIGLLAIFVISTAAFYACKSGEKQFPVIDKASDFELVNQNNEEIRLNQFLGKVVVLSFIYIRCPMPKMCPLTTKNFRRLQESLEDELSKNVVLLLITFDPDSDTPGALKKYGEMYGADFSNWHFLTGTKQAIDKVCDDYGIIHERQENALIRHSVILYLVDQEQNVRKMYIGNKWKPEEIKKDIMTLID
jgi:protein SCO1/2